MIPLALLLGGCSWFGGGSDNLEPPAELTDIVNPPPVRVLWKTGVGDGSGKLKNGLVASVSADQALVADYEGKVFARDRHTGRALWKYDADIALSAGPGVDAELAVVASHEGDVIALDRDAGAMRWSTKVSSEVLSDPLVTSVVIVRSVDGNVTALDRSSGEQLWQYRHPVPVLSLRGTASPVVVDDVVLIPFASGKLVALNVHTGSVIWEKRITIPRGRSELDRIVDLDSTPVVANGVIYLGGYQGSVSAVVVSSGVVLWERELSTFQGLAIAGPRLLVTDNRAEVWALDINTGAALWKSDVLHGRRLTAPVVHGDFVVVGDFEGYLHWLSLADGELIARVHIDGDGFDIAPIVVGDTVLVYSKGGSLAALAPPGLAAAP